MVDPDHGIPMLLERGSQQAVPGDDRVEGSLQPRGVESSPQPERARDGVRGRLRIELVHEPQAALRLGERRGLAGRPRDDIGGARTRLLPGTDGSAKPFGPVVVANGRHHEGLNGVGALGLVYPGRDDD
jgi:hypothetical protein